MPEHHHHIEPAHVTLNVGCAYTGDSRSSMYGAIAKGEVEAVKNGRRTLLVFESLKKRVAARKPALIGIGDPKFRALRSMGPVTAAAGAKRKHPEKTKRAVLQRATRSLFSLPPSKEGTSGCTPRMYYLHRKINITAPSMPR